LTEKSAASKKAAKLGLVHKGFGYYGPEGEEATHKSAQGGEKLYKLKKAYGKKIEKPAKKKTVKKKKKKKRIEKVGQSKIVYHTDDVDWLEETALGRMALRPIIKGEEIHILSDDKAAFDELNKLRGYGSIVGTKTRKNEKINRKYAEQQHAAFTAHLFNTDNESFKKLMNIQETWQEYSQWENEPELWRKRRNRFLNELFSGETTGKKALTKVPAYGIERGMVLSPIDAKAFLMNFKVGKRVVIPPSGWSARLSTARGFGPGGNFYVTDGDIAVLMTLKPKKGSNNTMIGYQCRKAWKILDDKLAELTKKMNTTETVLNGIRRSIRELTDDDETDTPRYKKLKERELELETELASVTFQWEENRKVARPMGYDGEHEIIRPGSVTQKVVRARKYIFKYKASVWKAGKEEVTYIPRTVYHIELEDAGPVGRNLWKEASTPLSSLRKKVKETLYKYMNSTFWRTKKPPKETIIKKYLNTNVRGGSND